MPEPHFSSQRLLVLLSVSVGIWGSFAWWSVLQERLITRPYTTSSASSYIIDGEKVAMPTTFHFPFFLNLVSYFACVIVATVLHNVLLPFGWSSPMRPVELFKCFTMGLTLSFGTPFGYSAMKHLSYPIVLTAKMCKSIPTMFVGFFVYRQRYDFLKYVGVLMLTFGVLGFSLFDEAKKKKSNNNSNDDGSQHHTSLMGLGLIAVNLLFDGYTQSSQDAIVKKSNPGSFQMMILANGLAAVFAAVILTVAEFVPTHQIPVVQDFVIRKEFSQALNFLTQHPAAMTDLLNMAALGAVGQVFIFAGITYFGTLTVMGLTVSRKIGSVMISIWLHDHAMNQTQMLCLALVVLGILIDSYLSVMSKRKSHHGHHHHHHGKDQNNNETAAEGVAEQQQRNTVAGNNSARPSAAATTKVARKSKKEQ